jgi:hypothetical protein
VPVADDDTLDPELAAHIERILNPLTNLGERLLTETIPPPSDLPPTLYHFTDAAGLIGIIKSKSLWVSHARTLNDAAEIQYALDLAKAILEERVQAAQQQPSLLGFRQTTLRYLDPTNVAPNIRVQIDSFVASFCPAEDSAHWLHYGRGGAGYAIGFDPTRLTTARTHLWRVTYMPAEQRRMLGTMIDALEEKFLELASGQEAKMKGGVERVAAHVLADTIWASAGRMKHYAFETENEWRLVSLGLQGKYVQQVGEPPPLEFRPTGSTIVPYYPIHYKGKPEGLPLRSIIVGSRVDFPRAEMSLRHLLRQHGYDEGLPIERSKVPLQ